ncbi:MAG TPA: ABC transporter ATP-binding protein [Patescibacteria group bacterium]|nr:ABC transporter ATP-binding protein [Patescibacteria group bacterium]
MSNIIEVKNLHKSYIVDEKEIPVLNGIDFAIPEGQFIAIMGPSGSGKSTLLYSLGLLDRPTSGHYFLNGKETSKLDDKKLAKVRNEEIGFIFQSFNLLRRTSIYDNVRVPLVYSNVPESKHKEMVIKALESVGLDAKLYKKQPSQLSGGEQQRVAIARAIINNPTIILADEPTGNLDSKSGAMVMKVLQDLNKKGHTIILVTHETSTSEHADRIIHLLDGVIDSDKKVANRRYVEKEKYIK